MLMYSQHKCTIWDPSKPPKPCDRRYRSHDNS